MKATDLLCMIDEVRSLMENSNDNIVKDRLRKSIDSYEESLDRSLNFLLTKNSMTVLRKLNTIEKELSKSDRNFRRYKYTNNDTENCDR